MTVIPVQLFPGGHVEQNEIFQKSIIREVWEETGLTIESPKALWFVSLA